MIWPAPAKPATRSPPRPRWRAPSRNSSEIQRHGGRQLSGIKGGLAPHLSRRVVEYLEARLGFCIRLRDLAGIAGLSDTHFQRAFQSSHGVSPHVWITHRRVARAKHLLRGRDPIAAIALACGFSSQSHLTRAFKLATGVTPAAYRRLV